MKSTILLTLFLSLTGLINSQTAMKDISHESPYQYEKRDGRLCIKSYIQLDEHKGKSIQLLFDNTPLGIVTIPTDGKTEVWLPLIGEERKITAIDNKSKKTLVEQMYTPLIPSDWGHFKDGTIHIISSSHQDIGWVNAIDTCRYGRIHHIINPAMKMIEEDPGYAFGMEQTLNLMEYLEEYPEKKAKVIENYKKGNFAWGATFNQPYEGLESGEQLVRQAYYGRKWIKENLPGCDDITAYNIDVPGRSIQTPQIFAKSGIKNLFVSRMREGLYDWYSPDGSKILTYTPGNYGWAIIYWRFFDQDAITAFHKLHHRTVLWSDYFKKHNIPPHYAILISYDAQHPANYKNVIDDWNKIVSMAEVQLPSLQHSTVESYLAKVNVPEANMEKVTGERPNLWLYIHGPAHYQAIKAKREAGVLLPAAEAFTTINKSLDNTLDSYPKEAFDKAWISSIYPDHGWGGYFGEQTDSIFRSRLEEARDSGNAMLKESLTAIAQKVNADKNAIIVFNDLTWARTTTASFEIDATMAGKARIKDYKGNIVPSQVTKEGDTYKVQFIVKDIPSMGYRTFYLASGKNNSQLPSTVAQTANSYENEYYKISFGKGGMNSLFDKTLQKELLNTLRFSGGDILNLEYKGNGAGEFTQIQGFTPGDLRALSHLNTLWEISESGELFTTFRNKQAMKEAGIIQEIRIYHSLKKIDLNMELDFDGTHNRQLRMALPLNMEKYTINYEVPMSVIEVGKDEMKGPPGGWSWWGAYTQESKEVHPREVQNFISANGSGYGVTLASGVPVADWIDPSIEGSDFPVLQGILLSSHKSCHGLGNWYHQTGQHRFSFSLLSHAEGWENGYQFGIEFNHPLQTVQKPNKGGTLPDSDSFIKVSNPFVGISILKKADNDNSIIIRLVEMKGEDTDVEISLPFEVKKVVKTNMIEEDESDMNISGKNIKLSLGHHSIETFKLIL